MASDERPLTGLAGLADWRLSGRLSRLLRQGVLTGSAGEAVLTPPGSRLAFRKLFVFGMGPLEQSEESLVERLSEALHKLASAGVQEAAMQLPARVSPDVGIRTLIDELQGPMRALVFGPDPQKLVSALSQAATRGSSAAQLERRVVKVPAPQKAPLPVKPLQPQRPTPPTAIPKASPLPFAPSGAPAPEVTPAPPAGIPKATPLPLAPLGARAVPVVRVSSRAEIEAKAAGAAPGASAGASEAQAASAASVADVAPTATPPPAASAAPTASAAPAASGAPAAAEASSATTDAAPAANAPETAPAAEPAAPKPPPVPTQRYVPPPPKPHVFESGKRKKNRK